NATRNQKMKQNIVQVNEIEVTDRKKKQPVIKDNDQQNVSPALKITAKRN
ncbi:15557_t:CDS:2, partial [Funneliformis caledonium]